MSDNDNPTPGPSDYAWTTGELTDILRNLPEELRAPILNGYANEDRAFAIGAVAARKPEHVLSPAELELLRKLTETGTPASEGRFLQRALERYNQKLADQTVDRMLAAKPDDEVAGRMRNGARFILDQPKELPVLWGNGSAAVWVEGEALMLTGSPGVGKTTVAGQLLRARLVGGQVLGMEVAPTKTKVLYLAMDRPKQIARALGRVLSDIDPDVLEEKLVVWEGPPPADVAVDTDVLRRMARDAGDADTLFVDSLKDAAIGLTDDAVGAAYNRARQSCLRDGIEVAELHHLVKRTASGGAPKELADVYGSGWLTAGAGSVVLLHGKAGDLVVEWRHLKQPVTPVGPFLVVHDHDAGTSAVHNGNLTPLERVRMAGVAGMSARQLAEAELDDPKAKPSRTDVERARRVLMALEKQGKATSQPGDAATKQATVWIAVGADPGEAFADELDELI